MLDFMLLGILSAVSRILTDDDDLTIGVQPNNEAISIRANRGCQDHDGRKKPMQEEAALRRLRVFSQVFPEWQEPLTSNCLFH